MKPQAPSSPSHREHPTSSRPAGWPWPCLVCDSGLSPGYPALRLPRLGSEGAAPATGRLFRQRRAAILPQGLLGVEGGVSRLRRGRRVCARPQCWKRFVCTCASAWGWTVSLWRTGRSGWLPLRRGGNALSRARVFCSLPAPVGGRVGLTGVCLLPQGKTRPGEGRGTGTALRVPL